MDRDRQQESVEKKALITCWGQQMVELGREEGRDTDHDHITTSLLVDYPPPLIRSFVCPSACRPSVLLAVTLRNRRLRLLSLLFFSSVLALLVVSTAAFGAVFTAATFDHALHPLAVHHASVLKNKVVKSLKFQKIVGKKLTQPPAKKSAAKKTWAHISSCCCCCCVVVGRRRRYC